MEKTKRYNVRLSLQGGDNETYSATFLLELPGAPAPVNSSVSAEEEARLASFYVASVFLIYGLSIVLLIASSIRRKRDKQMQDRQIHKYLREFQVVQETSSKSHYRQLKHVIAAKLEALPRTQPGVAGAVGFTQARLSHVVPLALGLPLPHWTIGSQRVLDAPQDQRRVESATKRHMSESDSSEPDYFPESSCDADVSAPTSPLNPPNYGDGAGEKSLAAGIGVRRLLPVGDNTCSWRPAPEIVFHDSANEDILPNGNGIPLVTTNTGLGVERDIDENSTFLAPNAPETPRSENEDGCVDVASSECYYVGCLEPDRETIL